MKNLLKLIRIEQTQSSTLSHLYVYDEPMQMWLFECYVLEDAIRKVKIPTATAIPAGVYPLKIRNEGEINKRYAIKYKATHKGMFEVAEIPNYNYVMIHIGNFIKDTEGCPLVGNSYVLNGKNYEVLESTKAYISLYKKVIDRVLANEYSIEVINHSKLNAI